MGAQNPVVDSKPNIYQRRTTDPRARRCRQKFLRFFPDGFRDETYFAWERGPRKQSRVLTHPVVTVFGFLAQPDKHIYLKPKVTQAAAVAYGFDLQYSSQPSWETYESLLEFADVVRADLADLGPLDMIDIQSFIWVLGSSEYDE
jgi:hypothetical protein